MQSGNPNSVAPGALSAHWTDRTGRHRLTHEARYATPGECRREEALEDWYGAEQASAEIAAHRSPARPVSELLDAVLSHIGLADAVLLERVRALWRTLVGDEVARRAVPVAVRGRVVAVEVASSAWQYVLEREHRARICDRLREATAGDLCEVRFMAPGRRCGSDD